MSYPKPYISNKTKQKIKNAMDAANIIYSNTNSSKAIKSLTVLENIVADYEEALYELSKHRRLYTNLRIKYKKLKELKNELTRKNN